MRQSNFINPSNIWESYEIKNRIVYHINYASVFNDVISFEELVGRLPEWSRGAIRQAVDALAAGGQIVFRKEFIAAPHLDHRIDAKSNEFEMTTSIINKKMPILRWLGKLPIVKFIGISGSIAAFNPAMSLDKKLDLDVIVVTSSQMVWLFGLINAILTPFIKPFQKYPLCFNLILDESDLKIYNRNFFTANELRNIIPIAGFHTYFQLLAANTWANQYYAGLCVNYQIPASRIHKTDIINKSLFLIFMIYRSLRRFSLRPLLSVKFDFDPSRWNNYNRRGHEKGGYQLFVHQKFESNLKKYFPSFYDRDLISALFEDRLGKMFEKMNFDVTIFTPGRCHQSEFELKYAKAS